MNPYYLQQVERVLRSRRVKTTTPIENMPDDLVDTILYGSDKKQKFSYEVAQRAHVGLRSLVRRRHQQPAAAVQRDVERLRQGRHREIHVVLDLQGLQRRAAQAGSRWRSRSPARTSTTSRRCRSRSRRHFFATLEPTERETPIAHQIFKEIRARLGFLANVGLGYLNLSRSATTLSGGESQRIRLGDADRLVAGRRALHPRRTVDRAAPARQRPAAGDAARRCATSATR